MKYDHLIQSMELDAEKKIQDISDRIARERKEIQDKARAEGESVRIETISKLRNRAAIEMNKKLYQAREEVNQNVALEHESAINEVFSKVRLALDRVRENSSYPVWFNIMLDEVLSGMTGDDIVLHVDPRDLDLCKKLVHDRGLAIQVLPDISTAGGLNGSCYEGKIIVRNTVEDRLLKAKKIMKSSIFRALYGD
ncbi:MAG TPA: V-type ATP synthase subunit E family protein [Methanoregulaceae archaeon]|nr:V-type ATP synthase subunit E family protein [Methanoregulaceae archaeon]